MAINPIKNDNRCKLFRSLSHRAHKKFHTNADTTGYQHNKPYNALSVWCHKWDYT